MKQTINLGIEGMTCAACSQRIEKVLNKDPNIISANINLATETGQVVYNDDAIDEQAIFAKISKIGYIPVKEKIAQEKIAQNEFRIHKIRLLVAIILSFPLLLTMLDHMPFNLGIDIGILMNPWLQFVLASCVQFIIGAPFYVSAYRAIRGGIANMDVLVVLGTSVAYVLSVVNTFRYQLGSMHHPVLYYETSAVLITFVLLGKYLEKRAKNQTTSAITSLIKLQPNEAVVINDGVKKTVSIENIKLGDIVMVVPGQRIPIDGKVIKGITTVDESLLTGESLPIDKKVDDLVIAGAVNQNGNILVEVTKVGQDTTLAQIIKIIENAQGEKVPIQRLADKISSVFVPVVVGISAVTFIVWMLISRDFYAAINASVAVLVIACPCALGLATPTAIMVGSGLAAKHGILFKGGQFLETLQKVDAIVFDKTGTLTTGQPEVVDYNIIDTADLPLIIAAESGSEHPLSKAIVRFGEKQNIANVEVESFVALPGFGLSAKVLGNDLLIGNRKLMVTNQIEIDETNELIAMEKLGQTVIFVAKNKKYIASFAIEDTIKASSLNAVKSLEKMNKEIIMLSGDNVKTASAIANKIGINNVLAEVLPDEKASKIKELQNTKTVAMVGDGINDAPALVTSDVGIALGTGSDVAIESADVTLINGDVQKVVDAVFISKQTMKTIKENLFWALVYNLIGIPIAASGLLAPWVAGAAMAFSSISVVLNSLRLRYSGKEILGGKNE